ncbi:hypothetical protein GCM10010466_46710 [Planomonospora alba]|uniref:Uncharacterized protein n=1 Tax=Planomonospora alba TaxID=161354 RepID=A0ABP6NJJ3_9ACTN
MKSQQDPDGIVRRDVTGRVLTAFDHLLTLPVRDVRGILPTDAQRAGVPAAPVVEALTGREKTLQHDRRDGPGRLRLPALDVETGKRWLPGGIRSWRVRRGRRPTVEGGGRVVHNAGPSGEGAGRVGAARRPRGREPVGQALP